MSLNVLIKGSFSILASFYYGQLTPPPFIDNNYVFIVYAETLRFNIVEAKTYTYIVYIYIPMGYILIYAACFYVSTAAIILWRVQSFIFCSRCKAFTTPTNYLGECNLFRHFLCCWCDVGPALVRDGLCLLQEVQRGQRSGKEFHV